jgi:DNA-directed RNA polymerase specialized sigma24 family protein
MAEDSKHLGYPSRATGMSTGGESSHEAFEHMIESMDKQNVKILDAVIDSLPKKQRQAIYARFLKTKKPFYYDKELGLAIDNLMTIVDRRIFA